MTRNKISLFALAALLAVSGCRKQLDINTNPNVATQVGPELLLPSAEVELAVAMGVDIQTNGSFWAQYWTQAPYSSQYKSLDQYQPSGSDFDREWGQFYTTLINLKKMAQAADQQQKPQYIAVSKLLSAYTFQVLTDGWGDIPYTDALKGEASEGQVLSPKYDPQSVVYDSLISLTNQGLALINTSDPRTPGSDDLIFGGDMEQWLKFGNTLLLKLYLRLAERDPGRAQAGVAALYASNAEFMGASDNAMVRFSSTSGNRNPLSTEIQSLNYTQNQVASKTAIDSFLSNNDPRITVLYDVAYDPIGNDNGYIGIAQGDYNISPSTLVSVPGPTTGADANPNSPDFAAAVLGSRVAPVRFLMGYESLFLQAEAAARGWSGSSDDKDLFEAAITASFVHLGLAASDATDYINGSYWGAYPAGSTADKIRHIITQKWFSMAGIQGFESWTEWRRTGFPDFFTISRNSLIGNVFPVRFPYPNTELTRNSSFPGQPPITQKVYWDVN